METTWRAALDAVLHAGRDLWDLLSADPVTLPALLMAAAAILALVLVATPASGGAMERNESSTSTIADGAVVVCRSSVRSITPRHGHETS